MLHAPCSLPGRCPEELRSSVDGTWCHSLDSSLRLMGLTRKSLAPALKASEMTSSRDSEDITAARQVSGQPRA